MIDDNTLEQAVHQIVTTAPTVAALIGTRFRPLLASKADKRPYATFSAMLEESIDTMDGEADHSKWRVRIECWADDTKTAVTTARTIRSVLHHYSNPDTPVQGVHITPALHDREADEPLVLQIGEEKPLVGYASEYRLLVKFVG